MNELKGIEKVFSFTLTQQLRAKGFRVATLLIAALLFVLPAGIMAAVEAFGGDDEAEAELVCDADTVFVADVSETGAADYNILGMLGAEGFSGISYVACESLDDALQKAEESETGLILLVENDGSRFDIKVLIPDNSLLTEDDARAYSNFINLQFQFVLVQKSGLDEDQLAEVFTPIDTTVTAETAEENEEDGTDGVKEVLSFLLPYLNIMILYFLVLFYGQGVANSVIMEKTSKLMDTFLVSVKPGAMVFGKVLAIVLASAMQFVLWIAAATGGFATGSALVKMIDPDTDMALIQLFSSLGELGGVFSAGGALVGVLIILGGFLLYCAVAAIGGAMAGKPEDLSSTNVLFTLILVVSFFATLSSGAMTGEMAETFGLLDIIPFTAILVTPSRLILGYISVFEGVVSLAMVLAVTAVFLFAAGKVYKLMALHKGDPPKLAKIFGMLRAGKRI